MEEHKNCSLTPRHKPRVCMTIEDLKKISDLCYKQKSDPLPRGLGWTTRLMAKLGWHREYEVIVIDKSKFGFNYGFGQEPKIKMPL